ncbi:MAG: n-acetylglutamate synthase [Bacteroidetes bacterium]|nr:n-acetylglutamate synthase [Bacteroidota bacterium]
MNYHNKRFRVLKNSENGETSAELIFHYQQTGNIVSSAYKGGAIVEGHLLGLVNENGVINMAYHQINQHGEIKTGTCISTPIIGENGKIRLIENWQWTSGDKTKGQSILEEI